MKLALSVLKSIGLIVVSLATIDAPAYGSALGGDGLTVSDLPFESANSTSAEMTHAIVPARAITPEGAKPPGRALLYSFLGTAIPVGIGTATALGKNELGAGALVALGGGVVGPALGHFYARRSGRAITGILIRGAAAGIGGVALTSASRSDDSEPGEAWVFLACAAVGAGSLIADIAGAPGSARMHNEEPVRARIGLTPFAGSVVGAPGAGVRLAF